MTGTPVLLLEAAMSSSKKGLDIAHLTQLENDENSDKHFDVFPSHDDDLPLLTGTDVANAAHPANVQDGHMIHPSIPLAPRPPRYGCSPMLSLSQTDQRLILSLALWRRRRLLLYLTHQGDPRELARPQTLCEALWNPRRGLAAARASGEEWALGSASLATTAKITAGWNTSPLDTPEYDLRVSDFDMPRAG